MHDYGEWETVPCRAGLATAETAVGADYMKACTVQDWLVGAGTVPWMPEAQPPRCSRSWRQPAPKAPVEADGAPFQCPSRRYGLARCKASPVSLTLASGMATHTMLMMQSRGMGYRAESSARTVLRRRNARRLHQAVGERSASALDHPGDAAACRGSAESLGPLHDAGLIDGAVPRDRANGLRHEEWWDRSMGAGLKRCQQV